jgi:hypothetical protein
MFQNAIPAGSAGRFICAVDARRDRCVMFRSKKTENHAMQRTALLRHVSWFCILLAADIPAVYSWASS